MNKVANVIFAYSPKNDDELELTVGDRIEVIGVEEEGWWKGLLKGRIGVFPSNFVQVVEVPLPPPPTSATSTTVAAATTTVAATQNNTNKLNSIFGSKVNSKNSTSSHSLNNINNNSNNNLNIANNNTHSNNNLIMNNTHHQAQEFDSSNEFPFTSADESLHSASSFNERRPKPLRGIGYGDIFAAGAKTKPLPADPTTTTPGMNKPAGAPGALANERLSTTSLANTLQKPIPKKPPPPAPADNGNSTTNSLGTNGLMSTSMTSSTDQAPALPPKPSNQFSPFSQNNNRPLPTPVATQQMRPVAREKARVIYAYKPSNDDELEMEIGDVIDVIDKNIEDAGWWKGELNGRIGVFPDNFVQLISPADVVAQNSSQQQQQHQQDWHNSSNRLSTGALSNISNSTNNSAGVSSNNSEGGNKIKSVFAGTPKGFSKELESNLERHSNPASFLSLKRNRIQQQVSNEHSVSEQTSAPFLPPVTSTNSSTISSHETTVVVDKQNGYSSELSLLESKSGKLNHITANRAKGPSRRPPSNILNKRNQLTDLLNNHKKESTASGGVESERNIVEPPAFSTTATPVTITNSPPQQINKQSVTSASPPRLSEHFSSSPPKVSLKSGASSNGLFTTNKPQQHSNAGTLETLPVTNSVKLSNTDTTTTNSNSVNATPVADSLTITTSATTNNTTISTPVMPKINQRQTVGLTQPDNKARPNSTSTPQTPPWMVELRKTNAEKKRDPPTSTSSLVEECLTSATQVNPNPAAAAIALATVPLANPTPALTSNSTLKTTSPNAPNESKPAPTVKMALQPNTNTSTANLPTLNLVDKKVNDLPVVGRSVELSLDKDFSNAAPTLSTTKLENQLKQISNNVTSEINELRNDVRKLQEEFKSIHEIKEAMNVMKIELQTCQSATESQKKYIKDLVKNLADERKKIAAMQVELDRNLK